MVAIGAAVSSSGIGIDDLGLQRPTLDDVFLRLTGHRAEDPGGDGAELEEVSA